MAKARKSAIIQDCVRLADELSDVNGFIPVRLLAAYFSITVVFRPLLVEAMLASVPASNGSRPQWMVLVDSDQFNLSQTDYENETAERPLPGRLRNTISHEILHSLSFRATDADFEFRMEKKAGERNEHFVKRIERETEELSPLLLVPEKCLRRLAGLSGISLSHFLDVQRTCAVTRDVLINRLRLWKREDTTGGLFGGGVENLGLGTGYWERGKAQLRRLPLFMNFRNGHLPHLFTRLQTEESVSVAEVTSAPEFILNGGDQTQVELEGHRQGEFLDYLRMTIRLSVEPRAAAKNGRFLYLIEKLAG
jgi:hypothetical protein